jgi:hypothetical protein
MTYHKLLGWLRRDRLAALLYVVFSIFPAIGNGATTKSMQADASFIFPTVGIGISDAYTDRGGISWIRAKGKDLVFFLANAGSRNDREGVFFSGGDWCPDAMIGRGTERLDKRTITDAYILRKSHITGGSFPVVDKVPSPKYLPKFRRIGVLVKCWVTFGCNPKIRPLILRELSLCLGESALSRFSLLGGFSQGFIHRFGLPLGYVGIPRGSTKSRQSSEEQSPLNKERFPTKSLFALIVSFVTFYFSVGPLSDDTNGRLWTWFCLMVGGGIAGGCGIFWLLDWWS